MITSAVDPAQTSSDITLHKLLRVWKFYDDAASRWSYASYGFGVCKEADLSKLRRRQI